MSDTIDIFWPIMRFRRVDLPTLGLPAITAKPERVTAALATESLPASANVLSSHHVPSLLRCKYAP